MEKESKKTMAQKMSNKPYISLKNVSKIFGENPESVADLVLNDIDKTTLQNDYGHIIGLQNISIDIPKNKIQVFMGLSGSGKSTLIRHINQLIRPTVGTITINNINRRCKILFVLLTLPATRTLLIIQLYNNNYRPT